MSQDKIALRYAKGLVQSLKSEDKSKQIEFMNRYQELLQSLTELLENPNVKDVFLNPVVASDTKKQVLTEILTKAGSDKDFSSFIMMLVDAGRLSFLPAIEKAHSKLLNETAGVMSAVVISAATIQDEHLDEIKSFLESKFDATIQLELNVDPKIMGGFIIRIGHRVLDLSLKSKLDKLTEVALAS